MVHGVICWDPTAYHFLLEFEIWSTLLLDAEEKMYAESVGECVSDYSSWDNNNAMFILTQSKLLVIA